MAIDSARLLGFGFLVGAKDEASPVFDRIAESAMKMKAAVEPVAASESVDRLSEAVASVDAKPIEDVADAADGLGKVEEAAADTADAVDEVSKSTSKMSRAWDGAKSLLKKIPRGFNRAKDAISGTASSTGRLDSMIQALSLHRLNQISSAMVGMAQRAGVAIGDASGLQATSIESFGVQFSNTYRVATAGLGQFSSIVDQSRGEISSLAYGLDVSADSMIAVNAAVARTGHSLDEFGISQRAVAGMLKSGLIDGQAFGNVLAQMTEHYGLTQEAAGSLVSTMVSLGEQSGDVQGAMSGLPQIMEALNTASAEFPDIADNMDGVSQSVMRLAVGMQRSLGGTLSDQVGSAISVFNKLTESRRSLTNMFTGLGSDFSELATEMGIAGGDINAAIDATLQNPAEFAQSAARMYGALADSDPTRAQRLLSVISQIDPNLASLVQSGEAAAGALEGLTQPAADAEDAFNRVGAASAHQSRTLAESMERNQDAFTTRLNHMTRTLAGGNRSILRRQRDAFNKIGGYISDFSQRSGPIGMLTRGFLRSRGGVYAWGSALQGLAGPLLDTASNMAPMVSIMSNMGVFSMASRLVGGFNSALGGLPGKLLSVLGPIGLLVGAGYLIHKNWDTIGPMLDKLKGKILDAIPKFEEFSAKVLAWVEDIDWHAMGQSIVQGIRSAFGLVGEAATSNETTEAAASLGRAFKNIFKAVGEMASGLASGLWEGIVNYVMSPSTISGQVGNAATVGGVAFGAALFTPMRGPIMMAGKSALTAAFNGIKAFMSSGAGAAGGIALEQIPIIGAVIGALMALPDAISHFQTGDMVGATKDLFKGALNGLLLGIPSLIDSVFGGDVMDTVLGFLFDASNIGNVVQAIQDGDIGRAIAEGLFTTLNTALMGVPGMLRASLGSMGAGDILGPMMESVGDFLNDIGGFASDAWDKISDGFSDAMDIVMPAFNEISDVAKEVFQDTIMPVVRRVMDWVGDKFKWLNSNIVQPVLDDIKGTFVSAFRTGSRMAISVISKFAEFAVKSFFGIVMILENVGNTWEYLKDTIRAGSIFIGMSIHKFFMNPFIEAKSTALSFVDTMNLGFLSIKKSVIGLGLSFVTMIRGLPGIGDALSGPLDSAIDSLTNMQTNTQRTITDLTRQSEEARRQALEEQRRNVMLTQQAQLDFANAGNRSAARIADNVRRRQAQAESVVARIHSAANRLTSAVNSVGLPSDSRPAAVTENTVVLPDVVPVSDSAASQPVPARDAAGRRENARNRLIRSRAAEAARANRAPRDVVITQFSQGAFRQLDHAMTVRAPRRRVVAGEGG